MLMVQSRSSWSVLAAMFASIWSSFVSELAQNGKGIAGEREPGRRVSMMPVSIPDNPLPILPPRSAYRSSLSPYRRPRRAPLCTRLYLPHFTSNERKIGKHHPHQNQHSRPPHRLLPWLESQPLQGRRSTTCLLHSISLPPRHRNSPHNPKPRHHHHRV